MKLLERQGLLDRLETYLDEADKGSGVMVLLGGEAGAGKTALMHQFMAQRDTTLHVLIGACDAMSTPRPLGPIFDIAKDLGREVQALLRAPDRRSELFVEILDALSGSPRVVLIIEDVHWADDATIDLLRFIGRRIERTHALLIVTYRNDEITRTHPLRSVLGDLATSASVRRMTVELLTPGAVRTLAEGTGIDAEALYARTDGNAFFVTEVIGSGGTSVPPSARDAVLSRSARLPMEARRALEVAAAVGGRISPRLLAEVSGADIETIDACIDAGLLQGMGDALMFRHELAREAVYEGISPGRREELHSAILHALLQRVDSVADYPRLAHHAHAAGDIEAVLRYAPEAAKRAAELGAHREAASQYARALHYDAHLGDERRGELLALAFPEEFAIGNLGKCATLAQNLIELAQRRGDLLNEATWHAWKAWALVHVGHNVEADVEISRAIELLEDLAPSPGHAHVWQIQSRLRMLNRDYALAVFWGERAIGLAQRFDLPQIHAGALNAIGSSRVIGGNQVQGHADLVQGLEIARAAHLHAEVASLLTNLGSAHGEVYRFEEAERYLEEAITFTRELDLDGWLWYVTAWLGLTRMFQGKWVEASELAHTVLRTPASDVISRIMALIALGRVRARRGDPEVWLILDEAQELSAPTGTLQRVAPTHAARAEAAWLAGDHDRTIAEARAVLDMAVAHEHPWHIGELGYWLWKAGEFREAPAGAAEPYARQMAGDWQGAADAWTARDCPYESARALADSGDEGAMREAFAVFDRMGAKPMATMVVRQLREMGAESIPRGARPATRANVALLTGREVDIASLLVTGMTNIEIAERLYLSPRTVEKHVSSILAKLDLTSRHKIAQAIEERGLLKPRS
jgi:DNA-binding CsgD family transcriptional regulator/tetratricopeptide (TPR) repeat protein